MIDFLGWFKHTIDNFPCFLTHLVVVLVVASTSVGVCGLPGVFLPPESR